MLKYKTETRPGLVALHDIWPGNGVGFQPRCPHGAQKWTNKRTNATSRIISSTMITSLSGN